MRSVSCLVVMLAGCATATSPQNNANTDAHVTDTMPGTDGHATDAALHDSTVLPDVPAGSCATPTSGVLASWNLAAAIGSQVSTPSSSAATGITAGPISRASGLTAAAGAGSINSSNWPISATLDATKYYTVTLTPPSGCLLDLTAMAIDGKASASGPNTAKVATSADSFAATSGVAVTTPSTPALAVAGATGMIELRIYGYGATATSGTFRVQNTLTISGSLH